MKGLSFDPPSVAFPKTYISASTRFALKIINTTSLVHHISFCSKQTSEEEQELISQLDIYDPEQRNRATEIKQYSSDVFSIYPMELDVRPHTEQQVFVNFAPLLAIKYISTAYVQIDDLPNRMALEMTAIGLPPMAQFLTSQIVVGNVFLDAIFEYRVVLKNIGLVVVDYTLEPKDPGKLGFQFNPSQGQIPVNNETPILVKFSASAVGQFNETFTFKIRGATSGHPQLTLSGKVIGPSFIVSPRRLDFEGIGYGFLHTKTFDIENKSEIPFDFTIRMSHDGSFERREFQIRPEIGTVGKFAKQEIAIDFIPMSIKSYNVLLIIDVARYGERICEIPLSANCICPSLTLENDTIDLQNAFIGYKYTKVIKIQNPTPYAAKFEFVPQTKPSRKEGIIEIDRNSGIVQAVTDTPVEISFTAQKIGLISLECFFQVLGSDEPPLKLTLMANSTGPSISLSQQAITLGTIPVLQPQIHQLQVTNNSLIPASFRNHLDSPTGGFMISPQEGTIPPKTTQTIDVTVKLNDIITFTGNLKICIDYLNAIIIPLKASGTGSPIISTIDMKTIDFGYILTEQQSQRRFILENKSNRTFEIRWTINKVQTPKDTPNDIVFTITPENTYIPGKNTKEFLIAINCSTTVPFTMPLQCHATVNRNRFQIYNTIVKGTFVQPLIAFSSNSLEFNQQISSLAETRNDNSPSKSLLKVLTQNLTIINKSKLALTIEPFCPAPFSISISRVTIEPGESIDTIVSFDPTFKTDFVSEVVQRKLVFDFVDHPQKASVNLTGHIIFPNLHLESTEKLDFDVLMVNTEKTISLPMTNDVTIPVDYQWDLISSDSRANRVFDVFPLYGRIEPGETIINHFSFYAAASENGTYVHFDAEAICRVEGGPDYVIPLTGGSAPISYKVVPRVIDFGSCCYMDEITNHVNITNTSKVPISFTVRIPRNSRFSIFTVIPRSGIIHPDDVASLKITIVPGLPRVFKESFIIEVSGIEDVQIDLSVVGQFSQVILKIPRDDEDQATLNLVENMKEKIERDRSSALFRLNLSTTNFFTVKTKEYNFTEEQLLEEEKHVILQQMTTKTSRQLTVKKTRRSQPNSMKNLPQSFVASYKVDFGELILSETTKRQFEVVNHSPFPITFEINSNSLKRTGFKIEPAMIKGMLPNASEVLEISFSPINRRAEDIGPVVYPIPVVFDEGHMIVINITAVLKMPGLNFSKPHFDFEQVIIGQTKIMTVQLQNVSPVSCEFTISPAEIMQANGQHIKDKSPPFVAIPDSGSLPPSSFMNICLHFTPTTDKTVNYIFPVNIKHNPKPSYVTVTGVGCQMQLIFNPSELVLPQSQPFSSSTTAEVTVSNPTPYPIEFYSLQFDQQLYTEEVVDPRVNESPFVTYTPKAKTPVAASKFAVCIIINGPPLSGKTTLAELLSKQLNLPILNLKELWKDTTDYLSTVYTTLCESRFRQGVIIDGLDALVDTGDNEVFLQQCLKQKNFADEITKNPFLTANHTQQSTLEKCLDIILSSLDGHFVFHVAISFPSEDSVKRRDALRETESKARHKAQKEEREALFAMSEEEYESLGDEERRDVDTKRAHFRKKILEKIEAELNRDENVPQEKHSKPKPKEDMSSSRAGAKKKPTKSIPTDPTQLASMTFTYSLGSIAVRCQNETERFKTIDPIELTTFEVTSLHQYNTIIVDGKNIAEVSLCEILKFIPPLVSLKEAAFRRQIPDPSILDDVITAPKLVPNMPLYFSIQPEEELVKSSKKPVGKAAQAQQQQTDNPEEALPTNLTNRWNVPPNGEVTLTIKFDPQMIGSFSDELLFAIARCSVTCVKLECRGSCLYPEIDRVPKHVFRSVISKFDAKSCPSYISETNELNFGYCLVCKERSGKQTAQYKESITLQNVTQFPVECTSVFLEQNNSKSFIIDPANFTIPPNGISTITIGFHPTMLDICKAKCVFLLKDNPEPFFMNFSGDSSQPTLEYSTSNVDFEKLLIGNEKSRKIELKNPGKIPAYWRLKNVQNVQPNINFNVSEGLIMPLKSQYIVAKFSSQKPIIIKKPVSIEVLEKENGRVFSTHNIQFTVESFDVNFDVVFPKGQQEQLDFSLLKVGQSKSLNLSLRNRGKYPVNFQFMITDTHASKFLKISQIDGVVVNGEKPLQINVTFLANIVVQFSNLKCISLKVVDSQTKQTTANLQYAFSAETYFHTFTVSCGKKIDFGNVSSNTTLKKEFTLTNTSPTPFDFEFHTDDDPSKNTAKAKPQAKGKPKKTANNAFNLGGFSIIPANGTIQPNSNINIIVDFMSTENGKQLFPLHIFVPDCQPSDTNFTIRLMANCFIPTIVIDDPEKIFPKVPLCVRLDLSRTNITAFLEDDNIIHFSPSVVNQSQSINVRLINPLPIDVNAEVSLKSKGKMAFDVSDKALSIPANSFKNVALTFSPSSADSFSAQFEAAVKNGTKSLKFGVEAEGTIPSISCKTQLDKGKGNGYVINLGKTLIGFEKQKVIAIGNDGPIKAVVQVNFKSMPDFEVTGVGTTSPVILDINRQFTFTVTHKPQKVRKANIDITVVLVDNPKSNMTFSFSAESFSEDLILEGLDGEDSELHFRGAVIGKSQTVAFTMKNVSSNTLRFMWTCTNDITFAPRVGHIHRFQVKEIQATFFTEKPTKYLGTKGACQISKILYDSKNVDDWDDTQKMVTYMPRSEVDIQGSKAKESDMMKVAQVVPEPAYRLVTPGKPREIPIKIFAISDLIKFSIDTTDIQFTPTMMFQARYAEIKMTNTCQIRFDFEWKLEKFDSLRTDYSSARPPAFSIEPVSGFIESGQSTTFRAVFAPLEVDDFTATFKCNIPFLTTCEPPQVTMSGLSRRPICHFNVTVTDYLTRRHPDFNDALPENVKVLELFSKAVGKRSSKKVEIINPTASPYETSWALIRDRSNGSITCDTDKSLISSGKRYMFSFTYNPNSAKTVECLYEFNIPEHEIKIPFLFVGRITH